MNALLLALLSGLLTCQAMAWCEPEILLDARTHNGLIQLDWKSAWYHTAWEVQFRPDIWTEEWTTLATVEETRFTYPLSHAETGPSFFRVVAVEAGELSSPIMLEDFERMPALESWTDEDVDPGAWLRDTELSAEGTSSLRLHGNTVKSQALGGGLLDSLALFQISTRVEGVADRQMIGFADSLNTLWYVIWGERGGYGDTPGQSGQVEISCYQGWFPEGEWVQVLLPVAADWRGKFGYQPALCRVLWANDSDDHEGIVWFDELLDVTGSLALRPEVNPGWEDLGAVGDSLEVRLFADELPGHSYRWVTGDGRTLDGAGQVIRLHTVRDHGVALLVEDAFGLWKTEGFTIPGTGTTREVSLGFTGDVMTARSYEADGGIIETQGVDAIFDSVRVLMSGIDLMQINLECAYTTADTEHPTKSITFRSHPANLDGIEGTGVDLVTLANNHTLDWMEAGMLETIAGLDSRGIPWIGSGMTSTEARKPVLLSHDGLSVGVLGMSDRTGNYNNYQPYLDAGPSRPGFALWSRADMGVTIPLLRDAVDLVVLQVHSGNEYSQAPTEADLAALPVAETGEDAAARINPVDSRLLMAEEGFPFDPEQHALYARDLLPDQAERSLRQEAVALGANLVITHHPHILQGFEVYQEGLIAHSMGNFVMDLSYLETMSTALLEVNMAEQAIASALVHPFFLENDLPRPCRGELSIRLLDHVADLSREFDTWVLRQPGAESGWIAMDTTALAFDEVVSPHMIELEERDGWYVSAPLRLDDDGSLATLQLLGMTPGVELRLGSDRLWWGNMEDEGAGIWDINSSDERYTESVSHRGQRSIEHEVSSGETVRTYYTTRAPCDEDSEWSLSGYIRTQNAAAATLQMRYYESRSGGVTETELLPAVSGSQEWTRVWLDLAAPEDTRFGQVRLELAATSGTSLAWYDDISLVEWKPWEAIAPMALRPVAFPSGLRWLQVRTQVAATSIELQTTSRICSTPPEL